jgi:hypothetical protein
MNKTFITVLLGLILITGIVSMTYLHTDAEAKKKVTYKYNVKVTIRGTPECVAQSMDEVYFRISDAIKNPDNNDNHDHLVVKGEKEGVTSPQTVTFSGTFDPVKFQKKYGVPLIKLREYIEIYKNDVEVYDEYKPLVTFDPKRTSYSFSHGVNFGCE